MAIERTLSILKPDAVKNKITGSINSYIEKSGLKIIAQRKILRQKNKQSYFMKFIRIGLFLKSWWNL